MNSLALMLLKNLHRLPRAFGKLWHYAKHTEKYPELEKYRHIQSVMKLAVQAGNVDLVVSGQENQEANASWLLEFQNWVQRQDALGLAPKFGDDPKNAHIRAENGKFSNRRQVGSAIYVVTLTADFTKNYEVN